MANGGFIGKRLVPNVASAKGVWNVNELYNARLDGLWPATVVEIVTDFLIIAGGGGGHQSTAMPGGGAGGYLNSYGSEPSGGNSASLNAMSIAMLNTYAVTIGAGGSPTNNGSNTSFSGTASDLSSISYTAIGGGAGKASNNGGNGGSGGAGGYGTADARYPANGGSGTSNQGFDGGKSGAQPNAGWVFCTAFGGSYCNAAKWAGGGGGGAGGVGGSVDTGVATETMVQLNSAAGGAGLASLITGTSVTRAAGGSGYGTGANNYAAMPAGSGPSSNGGGGRGGNQGNTNVGGDGIIILRYPNVFSLTNPGGGLTISTATDGNAKVSSITAGSGNIQFGVA